MTENWNLVKVFQRPSWSINLVTALFAKVGSKAGSQALMGGLLSKLKAGALAESRGEENPEYFQNVLNVPNNIFRIFRIFKIIFSECSEYSK